MPATDSQLNTKLMVGLEIHVELATRTKMFTSAPNVAHPENYEAEPNTLLDPLVIGMPGTLPVVNEKAVEMSALVGLALNCKIANFTKWDRKSYYYPDLPKNYQISQYDLPVCGEGYLDIPVSSEPDAPTKRIRILRAHLEEDAGKLLHEAPGGSPIDGSIVDLNRAGTPLLEIVTYPDFETADEVVQFGQALRDICRHLGVSEGIMQKGHMRFEPNINVHIEVGSETVKTPIVEIKNLNSFKAVWGSIEYEHYRQVEEWKETGKVMAERAKSTRGWDDAKNVTTHQRYKEDADEYRYFPDPDLVPVTLSDEWIANLQQSVPELPLARRKRYIEDLGLDAKSVDTLIDEPALTQFFEAVMATGLDAKAASKLLLNYGAKHANQRGCTIADLGITAQQIHDIAKLADGDKISSSAADKLFELCCDSDDAAEKLAGDNNLIQVSDTGELEGFVDQVLSDEKNAKIVEDIAGGKDKAIGALLGQIMKLSRGKANPKLVGDLIKSKVRGE